MSRSRKYDRKNAYEREAFLSGRSRQEYVYGNTVRRPERHGQAEIVRPADPSVRKNRDKARYMSAGYMLFLAAALCTAILILVNYVQLQAEMTNRIRSVAAKKSELNGMREANDEEYDRIVSSVRLDEIKRIAIGELGMTYAQDGQIVFYTNEGADYMRPVPKNN